MRIAVVLPPRLTSSPGNFYSSLGRFLKARSHLGKRKGARSERREASRSHAPSRIRGVSRGSLSRTKIALFRLREAPSMPQHRNSTAALAVWSCRLLPGAFASRYCGDDPCGLITPLRHPLLDRQSRPTGLSAADVRGLGVAVLGFWQGTAAWGISE